MEITSSICTEIIEGPEYELAQAFGACNIDRLDMLLRAFELCREYSMDPRAFCAAVNFAGKLAELGAFTEEEAEAGRLLASGDGEMLLRLIELTGKGAGLGVKLALGADCLAEHFGHTELIYQKSHADETVETVAGCRCNWESRLRIHPRFGRRFADGRREKSGPGTLFWKPAAYVRSVRLP